MRRARDEIHLAMFFSVGRLLSIVLMFIPRLARVVVSFTRPLFEDYRGSYLGSSMESENSYGSHCRTTCVTCVSMWEPLQGHSPSAN
jgi:hypothetical protein